jgi:hypothetical protein
MVPMKTRRPSTRPALPGRSPGGSRWRAQIPSNQSLIVLLEGVQAKMSDIPMHCRLCGQPLKSELERAADEAGNFVHQACYENQIMAVPNGQSSGTPARGAAHAAQRWVALYHLALVELDRGRMPCRLNDARHEIFDRVEELRDLSGSHDVEHQAIQDALANMRSLDKEQQKWAAQQEQRAG